MLNLSETIKRLRTEHHYTQTRLADLCGVSRQAVAKWETGTNLPDIEKLLQLAQLFHTSVDALLTGNGEPVRRNSPAPQTNDCAQAERIVNQALQKALSCKEPDEVIYQFLSCIGSKIGCERMYIFEANSDGSYRNTYEWCGKGVAPQIEYLQRIPPEDMALWLKTFSKGEYVYIEDVDTIAETEPEVYRWLKPQGIRSIVVCPLFGGRCFLGVDNPAPAFIAQTSSLLGIMLRFVEMMLDQRGLVQKLKWADLQTNQISKESRGVRYRLNVVTGQLQYDKDQAKALGYSFKADTMAQLEKLTAEHPEFHDHLMLDGIQRAIETKENASVEFLSYRQDRKLRWNRLSVSPFLDHEGNVLQLYGILQDLSGEHQIIEQYNKYISRLSGGMHICFLSRPIHLDYASDDLCDFLGYTREEFERVVGTIYVNAMVEEDRPAFAAYANRLAAGPGNGSCEYRLRKKDGTVVQMIDTMESVDDGSGILYGYAYVLEKSNLHAMLEMAEENEKLHLAVIDRQYEVLESLGKDYLNVFRVLLDEDKAQIVGLHGYVTKGMNPANTEPFPYYRFCRQYIQDRVHPDDQQKMLTAMHPDTVRKAFSEDDEYLVVYRALDRGETHYYQLKYIRLRGPQYGDRICFVAGFKNVDRVIAEEHRQKEQLQSRLGIINAILQPFACGYLYSREDDSFIELSNKNEPMSRLIGKRGSFTENRKRMEVLFPDKAAFRRIDDFLDLATLDERLNGGKFLSEQVFIKGNGSYELYILVVDCDADGRVSHCILAARDITREKEREQKYIRSLGISNRRAQTAMLFAYQDSLTGVMNRNAYERDLGAVDMFETVGFIFCDVNGLKLTNDTEGHDRGDQLLKDFAGVLKQHFSADCIYRIGGDEFICMIGNIGREKFAERAEELRRAVAEAGNIASFGTACGSPAEKESLVREAEVAMYRMKEARKDGQEGSE